MSKLRNPDTDLLFEGILKLQTVEECYRFFTDICTIKELQAMTQRCRWRSSFLRAAITMRSARTRGSAPPPSAG